MEEKKAIKMPHNVIMEDRKNVSISGVSDVDSFDEQTILAMTDLGELTLRGADLHITNLNLETGELSVNGKISSLTYSDEQPHSGGFFSKVFR